MKVHLRDWSGAGAVELLRVQNTIHTTCTKSWQSTALLDQLRIASRSGSVTTSIPLKGSAESEWARLLRAGVLRVCVV